MNKSNKSNKLKKSKKYKFRKNTRKIMGGAMSQDECKNEIKKAIVQALDNELSKLDTQEKKNEYVEKYKMKITQSLIP